MDIMNNIILPAHPLFKHKPDDMYQEEFDIASKYGTVYLFDIEMLPGFHSGKYNPTSFIPKLKRNEGNMLPIFYYGWMISEEMYQGFDRLLNFRGYQLTNNWRQYLCGHHFESWYDVIADLTPKSTMLKTMTNFCPTKTPPLRAMIEAVISFQKDNHCAVLIKDSVKSLKHAWNEACFIPADANPFHVSKVVATFLNLKNQMNDFQGHFVIRKFVDLKKIGLHPQSKMPISQEYRAFVLNGKIISQDPYWEGDYDTEKPPSDLVKDIAKRIYNEASSIRSSNLFTIDTAQLIDGTWTCIEVGDGQVSSIPPKANKDKFFSALLGADIL